MKKLFVGAFCLYGLLFAQQAPTVSGCPTFPANNIWNTPVDTLPVHARSADYINSINANSGVKYDMTMPVTTVPGTQPLVAVNIAAGESDPGPYPVPPNVQIEAGDGHIVLVDKDHCMLYETYDSVQLPDGSLNVVTAAKWSLQANDLRTYGWTSADAAGLPILPGLVRYEEILAGQINHALRFTAPNTQRAFVWPARHYASYNTSPLLPPMGQRFRLKASFDISGYSPNMQVILRAMKKYGIMLADNGIAWSLQGKTDSRWSDTELLSLRSVLGSNFEAVDVSSLMISSDSAAAVQPNSPASVSVTPSSVTLAAGKQQQFTAAVTGSSQGIVWSLTPAIGTLTATGLYTAPSSLTSTSTATVTAALADGSARGSATLTLNPVPAAVLSGISVSPAAVTSGTSVAVTVNLTAPAPASGALISLTGSNGAFPAASVTVASGQASQTFTVPVASVATSTPVTVTASYNSTTASAGLTVNPAAGNTVKVSSVYIYPGNALGGTTETVYVYLNSAAPAGGAVISLTSTVTGFSPQTVTVPAGSTGYLWAIATSPVSTTNSGAITATYNNSSAAFNLTLSAPATAPKLSGSSLSPSSVKQGGSVSLSVSLNSAAPASGAAISVSSSNGAFQPMNLVVPAGSSRSQLSIPISSTAPVGTGNVIISYAGASLATPLTITANAPAKASISLLYLYPPSVAGGSLEAIYVYLTAAAPAGGASVLLTSTVPGVPNQIMKIPAGFTNYRFVISIPRVSSTVKGIITASYNGSSLSAPLQITP